MRPADPRRRRRLGQEPDSLGDAVLGQPGKAEHPVPPVDGVYTGKFPPSRSNRCAARVSSLGKLLFLGVVHEPARVDRGGPLRDLLNGQVDEADAHPLRANTLRAESP